MFTRKRKQQAAAYEKVAPNIMKIIFQPSGGDPANSYAEQLRSLGQMFEKLNLTAFELEREGDSFTVSGDTPAEAADAFSLIQLFQRGARGEKVSRQAALAGAPVKFSYSPSDVENLSLMGRAKRAQGDKVPDGHRMAQILRAVGGYLDKCAGAQLLSISVARDWITLRYRGANGRVTEEKRSCDYYYEYWVKMYLRRKGRAPKAQTKEPTLYVRWDDAEKSFKLSNSPG